MSNLTPPTEGVDSEGEIDILTKRVGNTCTLANLVKEINTAFASTGVSARLEIPKTPFLVIKVPQALPQEVDAFIITLITVGYQDLPLDLASFVNNLNGYRRYMFV